MITRRDLLKLAAAGTTSCAFASSEPVLGLISPVAAPVPPEAQAMYAGTVRYLTADVGLATMTPEGYDAVLERIAPTAAHLAQRGADAIALLGTSLSFYQGAAFNRALTDKMMKATGRPVVTMSTAIVEGLRSVGGRRLAVATAYNAEVNSRLRTFLHEEGFEVVEIRGLGIEDIRELSAVTQKALFDFSVALFESTAACDAMLVSCGGLRTLELLEPLEQRCKIPVVSSLPHALRAGVRLLGLSGKAPGYGRLLSS